MATTEGAQPGGRWRAHLQPIDQPDQAVRETIVILIDYDPRTNIWTVEEEGGDCSKFAICAKDLISKI